MLTTGLAIRLAPGVAPLFIGAALGGAAIAVGNVSLPVIVRQNFPDRTGLMTGVYMTSMVTVAAISAAVAVPTAEALGDEWRPGLAIWALPAVLALAVWLTQIRNNDKGSEAGVNTAPQPAAIRPLLRDPVAWQVTLFFGLQSCAFYVTLSWLPTIYEDEGIGSAEAGALLGVVLAVGIPLALTIPSYATRLANQRALAATCTGMIVAGFAGLIAAPGDLALLWAVFLGIGLGIAFPLAQIMVQLRSSHVESTAGLSAMSQSIGYVIAAAGPLAVGIIHDVSGSWNPALVLMLVLGVAQLAAGLGAARDRVVAATNTSRPVFSPAETAEET
jgi:CP family cyanate transporter-like MFS transporter